MTKILNVYFKKGQYLVKKSGKKKATKVFEVKEEAVAFAEELAKRDNYEVIVRDSYLDEIFISCDYCDFFYKSPTVSKTSRECIRAKKKVARNTKICKQFKPGISFWCNNFNYWIDTKVCVHRTLTDCKACRVQRKIAELVIDYDKKEII